jgi:pimeloyl-ACP methyl ester carboxylesterase
MQKILLIVGIVIVVLIAGCLIFVHLIDFGMSDKEMKALFAQSKNPIECKVYKTEYGDIQTREVGKDSTLPLLLFVHGSPGSWDAFAKYMADNDLQSKYRLISVDRWGYGGTMKGKPQGSLYKQAAIIQPIALQNKHNQNITLVGHSYGGPTIARFAMDYPSLVQNLIFLAPSIDPEQEKVLWYQKLAKTWLIRNVLPADIDVCNREILPLKKELTDMLPFWKNITASVLYFHGKKDRLVPYQNAIFAQKQLTHVPFELIDFADQDHFIPWTKYEDIKVRMLALGGK